MSNESLPRNKWSQDELDILSQMTEKGATAKEIATALNRTFAAVQRKRWEYYHASKKQLKPYRKWTEYEIQRLEELHGTCSVKDIANILNRSVSSVQKKAEERALYIYWKQEELELLKEICGEIPSHLLGRTYNSRARRLGFKTRTAQAIASKAAMEGFSLRLDCSTLWYTPASLAFLFGVNHSTVVALIKKHPELVKAKRNRNYYISRDCLRTFIINNPGFIENHKHNIDMCWLISIIA